MDRTHISDALHVQPSKLALYCSRRNFLLNVQEGGRSYSGWVQLGRLLPSGKAVRGIGSHASV